MMIIFDNIWENVMLVLLGFHHVKYIDLPELLWAMQLKAFSVISLKLVCIFLPGLWSYDWIILEWIELMWIELI